MNKMIIKKLKQIKPILNNRYGVEKFAIFGSQARDDYTKDSDIDIAIISMKNKNFDAFIELREYLKNELKMDVDVVFFDSMNSFIKNEIKKEMIYV